MQKLILIRFGMNPNPAVTMALTPHISGRAIATQIPGAIMSVFNTESTLAEVSESVKAAGVLFVMCPVSQASIELPEPLMAVINALSEDVDQTNPGTAEERLTIDDVLDLISQNGIDSLTPAQRQILEQGRQ